MTPPVFRPLRRRALLPLLGLLVPLLSCGSATLLKVDGGQGGGQGGRTGETDGGAGTTVAGHSGAGAGGAPAAGGKGGDLGGAGATGAGAAAGTGGGPCSPVGTGSVAILDCPCTEPGKLACNGNAQAVTLLCSQGAWALNQTCSGQNLCDSRVGTCQPIDPLCQGATLASQNLCSSAAMVAQCGPDRVSSTPVRTCSAATPVCLGGACVACAPTSTQACGPCADGIQTCGSAGSWGPCMNATALKTYYRDSDHDGYGDPATSTTACGSAPSGYVANAGDCCDLDANAHPGQTGFFSAPDACGSAQVPDGYDYNCDGKDSLQNANLNPSCTSMASTACGCSSCWCDQNNVCAAQCTHYSAANPACGSAIIVSVVFVGSNCSPGGTGASLTQGCN